MMGYEIEIKDFIIKIERRECYGDVRRLER